MYKISASNDTSFKYTTLNSESTTITIWYESSVSKRLETCDYQIESDEQEFILSAIVDLHILFIAVLCKPNSRDLYVKRKFKFL